MTDPTLIFDLVESFRRSKVMFTAVSLGIFDRTPASAETLAKSLDVNQDALERLLYTCVGLSLLVDNDGVFRNTAPADDYLRRSSPISVTGYINYSNRVLYPLWGNIEDAIREGTHRWEQTFGYHGSIFEHHFHTPEMRREFLLGMHAYGLMSSPKVVAAFDLSRFKRFVDLGGATGHLALAAVDRYAGMKATLFDLPAVVETAREFVGDRVELMAGDFFTDPLPSADLYAVGRILHDWTEAKIHHLLAKIHAALPEHGGLLIAEKLIRPDKAGPMWARLQSLSMLVCTEGKERTLTEYEGLLRETGFRSVEGAVTDSPLDAVLAVK